VVIRLFESEHHLSLPDASTRARGDPVSQQGSGLGRDHPSSVWEPSPLPCVQACCSVPALLLPSRTGQRGLLGLGILWGCGRAALGEKKMNFPLAAKFELVTPR